MDTSPQETFVESLPNTPSENFNRNKDHQRMMVEPMFKIVQSLRSFLSAVTPTAVIPTAVA